MKRLFIILFVAVSIAANAQNAEKARVILDKVSEKTEAYPSIEAKFDFGIKNEDAGIEDVNPGEIIIQGEKFKLKLASAVIFNNGKLQWTLIEEAGEVQVTEPDYQTSGINPANIFTIYKDGYTFDYLGKKSYNGKKVDQIELKPEVEGEFTRIVLSINNDRQIEQAMMETIGGNVYTITIEKMKTDRTFSETTFEFDQNKYPNISVIDLR